MGANSIGNGAASAVLYDRTPDFEANGNKNHRVEFAVVGYGNWGSKHVRVLAGMPDVAVTVVDRDPLRLAEAGRAFPMVRSRIVTRSRAPDGRRCHRRDTAAFARGHRARGDAVPTATYWSKSRSRRAWPNAKSLIDAADAQPRAAHGGPHLRARRRDLEAARDREQRRARRDPLHRLRATQPRAVPRRRERHLGPRTARRLDHQLHSRPAAHRGLRLGSQPREPRPRRRRAHPAALRARPACARTST